MNSRSVLGVAAGVVVLGAALLAMGASANGSPSPSEDLEVGRYDLVFSPDSTSIYLLDTAGGNMWVPTKNSDGWRVWTEVLWSGDPEYLDNIALIKAGKLPKKKQ